MYAYGLGGGGVTLLIEPSKKIVCVCLPLRHRSYHPSASSAHLIVTLLLCILSLLDIFLQRKIYKKCLHLQPYCLYSQSPEGSTLQAGEVLSQPVLAASTGQSRGVTQAFRSVEGGHPGPQKNERRPQ